MRLTPSPDQISLREKVAGIGRRFGIEYFVAQAHAGDGADALWETLAEAGLLGVNLPAEFGGGGGSLADLVIVTEELAAAGCPFQPLIYSQVIGGNILAKYGSPDQKQHWLRRLATGKTRMSFALTERTAGSNSQNLAMTAERCDGGFVLTGAKTFVAGVEGSEAILVAARTGTDAVTGKGRLSLFLVDRDAPGLAIEPYPIAMIAPDRQSTLTFNQVVVPRERLVGGFDEGFRVLFDGLNPERVLGAALGLGIGRYALGKATDYASQRQIWGQPIGAHQGVAHPLAEARIELECARLLMDKAVGLYDAGLPAGEAANMAKLVAADAGVHCLDRAIQTYGGHGLALENGLTDLWWMARALQVAPVSREMVLNFVAEHSLGLAKSY